jgi:hypothetical protein
MVNRLSRYKYTVQTEGTSYSGRLKYLQLCRSALITHPLEWEEFHTHLMRLAGPDVNFIEASANFTNLEAAMNYYRDNDADAEKIARNSYETFARRYLTPAAVSTCCHTRILGSDTSTGDMLLEKTLLDLGIRSRFRARSIHVRRT